MRYLHPVQAHERFVGGGRYCFTKAGAPLPRSESWTRHAHPDGETFIRVDMDARADDGKSLLLEALQSQAGQLARLDLRYESERFEGGVQQLRATYQFDSGLLQVGFSLNGAERQYAERRLPADALIDVPLLVFRGPTIARMALRGAAPFFIFVPMYEHTQLFPGALQQIQSPVEFVGDDVILLGKRALHARRYRYLDRAASYWIDAHGVIVKRVSAFKQQETIVEISNYVPPAS